MKLKDVDPSIPGSDYINANYIKVRIYINNNGPFKCIGFVLYLYVNFDNYRMKKNRGQ